MWKESEKHCDYLAEWLGGTRIALTSRVRVRDENMKPCPYCIKMVCPAQDNEPNYQEETQYFLWHPVKAVVNKKQVLCIKSLN